MFLDFRLQYIILSDSSKKNNFNFYFCARLLTCIISIIIISIITLCLQHSLETKCIILLIGWFKFFESFGEIFLAQKQREFSLKETFFSKFMRTVFGCILFLIFSFLTKNIFFGSLALFGSSFFVFVFYEMRISKITLNFKIERFFYTAFFMIKKYYILGFVSLLASLSTNIPRYFISYYWDMEAVGVYSILSYISTGMVLFITTSFQLYIPRISNYIRNAEIDIFHDTMKKLAGLFLIFGIIVFIFFMFTGQELFKIIFNKDTNISRLMISITIIGGIFHYISLVILYTLTSANLLRQQLYFYVGDICIVLIVSYLLIPSYAVLGGCIAYLIVSMYHTICGILYAYYKRQYFLKNI